MEHWRLGGVCGFGVGSTPQGLLDAQQVIVQHGLYKGFGEIFKMFGQGGSSEQGGGPHLIMGPWGFSTP